MRLVVPGDRLLLLVLSSLRRLLGPLLCVSWMRRPSLPWGLGWWVCTFSMKKVESCLGTREPLNLRNSDPRATPELRIARIDMKFRDLAHGNAPQAWYLRNNALFQWKSRLARRKHLLFRWTSQFVRRQCFSFFFWWSWEVREGQGRSLEVPDGVCSLKYDEL